MPRHLSEEIDDAKREIECLKAALSRPSEGDGESYLGLRGSVKADRSSLLQLLQMSLTGLDRLREKEIVVLKATTTTTTGTSILRDDEHLQNSQRAAATAGCVSHKRGGFESAEQEQMRGSGQRQPKLSDINTWVSCRAFLDSMGVGDLRLVNSPVPRDELSVTVDALHMFQWPKVAAVVDELAGVDCAAAATATHAATAAAAETCNEPKQRAGLAAYLNAVMRPARGNVWFVPATGAAAAASATVTAGKDDRSRGSCCAAGFDAGRGRGDYADFLSIPSVGSRRRRPVRGAVSADEREGLGGEGGVIRGSPPSAAICLSEAVSIGAPALGLRVVLEIVRPPSPEAGSAGEGAGGASACGTAVVAGGQAALYRAIAVLVAANRKSPLTRPVVLLTDLRSAWKLLWLGGARSAITEEDGVDGGGSAGEGEDVFMWRLSAADAASVVRSMLEEETVGWDGQVSWAAPSRASGAAAAAAGGLHGGSFDGQEWAQVFEGGGGGTSGGGLDGPMAALRDRHLVGRRHLCRNRGHPGRRECLNNAAVVPANHNGSNNGGGGAEGLEYYSGGGGGGGITRTFTPPLAMEMALRRGGSSTFTGHSLPGPRNPGEGDSLVDAGEQYQLTRESRAFSCGGYHGSSIDRASQRGRSFSCVPDMGHAFDESCGGGGPLESIGQHSAGGGGGGHLANGDYFDSGGDKIKSKSNHTALNGYSSGGAFASNRAAAASSAGMGGRGRGSGARVGMVSPPPPPRPPPTPPAQMNPLADGGSGSGGSGSVRSILRRLMPFSSGDGFLFIAGVSRSWRGAWGVERPPETTVDAAVQSPSRLSWARASGLNWGPNICSRAAAGVHLATLRYARALKCPWDWRTCAHATTRDLVPVGAMIQWAASRPAPTPLSPSWGGGGHVPDGGHDKARQERQRRRLEVLVWLRQSGCPWDESTTSEAAREGNMEILKYARENGCPFNVLMCAYAAAGGHLDVLKWAREEVGCGWNEATCAFAAAGGHLEILKWARSRGCPWGEETCASAARGGRLEVLKWARQNGCPWGGGTCANAAEGGHMAVLQYAKGEGCPWTEASCTLAAREGHLEILKWCRENGCPWAASTFRAAAGAGNMEMLQFLFDGGCPWDKRTCAAAAKNSDLAALRFLRLKGCPWDARTLDAAAEVGAVDVFEWATTNKCPS